jgi:hypothetical protein
VPVISDVLTPQNFHAHDEHKKLFYNHFVVKGAEARASSRRLDAQGKPQNRRGSGRKSCRRSRSGNGLGGGLTIMQRSHGPRAGDQRHRVSYYRRSMGVGETPLFALHLGFTLTGAIAVGDAFTVASVNTKIVRHGFPPISRGAWRLRHQRGDSAGDAP